MNLDLNELLGDWDCSRDDICARLVRGDDGAELVQLRVDLGVLQMFLNGRPDGARYRGLPSVREYFQHEDRVGRDLTPDDWRELYRELQQYNYRRLALASLAEAALGEGQVEQGQRHLHRALRDIEHCVAILGTLEENDEEWDRPLAILVPTLIFNRARLRAQLRVAEGRFDEAIEEAETGARALERVLAEAGGDEHERAHNPAVAYLAQVGRRLREKHGITQTLKERLDQAVAQEDFEAAARLRDELRRRRQRTSQPRLSLPEED